MQYNCITLIHHINSIIKYEKPYCFCQVNKLGIKNEHYGSLGDISLFFFQLVEFNIHIWFNECKKNIWGTKKVMSLSKRPEILRDNSPWDREGFRLKNIQIRRTVSRKIACIVGMYTSDPSGNFIFSSMNLHRIWEVGRG